MKTIILSFFLLANTANALQILQPVDGHTKVKQQNNIPTITQEQTPKQLLINLKKSAKSGDARAQYSLANMYHNGTNIAQDEKLAFYWYLQVAKQGYASAQLNVANYYYDGVGTNKNVEQAAHWYKASAQQGNLDARYYWALMLLTGEANNQDTETALSALLSLSKEGHTLAQYQLSQIYKQGIIVEQNDELSEVYLYQASRGGHTLSQYQLGKIYQQKQLLTDAIRWLTLAAEQNHKQAKTLLNTIQAKIHQQQLAKTKNAESTPIKLVEADTQPRTKTQPSKIKIKAKPSIQGKPTTNTEKITLLSTPARVVHTKPSVNKTPISEVITVKTTPIALTLNPAPTPSQFQIARSLIENNRSTPDIQALILRAKQGNAVAQYNLGVLFSKGELVPKDNNKASTLIQTSAKQGLTRAQNALAMMYINGIGVEPNIQLANFWAQTSARQGDQKGIQILLYLLGITQL